jgi:polyvinyl alcohol dehydrogenase (cytochrome)
MRRNIWIGSALALALGVTAPVSAQERAMDVYGLRNHHANLNATINAQDVGKMRFAWRVDTKEKVSHTPLVENDRVFFADWGGTVYAADLNTGRILWQNKVENPKTSWPWYGFAGTGAMGEGRLYEASVEGNAFALDQNTGEVIWKVRFADDPEAGNVGKILYYDGLVYIGHSSVEEVLTASKKDFEVNFQGKVTALDARTGAKVWERVLVPPDANGVAVWSSFAVDPETNTLYFTTGNNYTKKATELADALVAADAKTGEIKWHRQVNEHDLWTKADPKGPDYDFGAGPQLFEAGGRKLVGAGNKSGVFFVWDRTTGEQVWSHTVGYGHIGGGIHGEASIGDGRIYIWGNNAFPYANPEKHPMDLTAVDARTGEAFWTVPKAQPAVQISAGFLANDVWFVGSLDGMVRAYRASDGKLLWRSDDHGPVASSLVAYRGTVMWGAGVPKQFGGGDGDGVVAYRVNPEARALTPPDPTPEKDKGCDHIICTPKVTFLPSGFLLPLGEPARTAPVRIQNGQQVVGEPSEGEAQEEFAMLFNVSAPTFIPRTSVFIEMIWFPFLEGKENPFTEYAVGSDQIDDEDIQLNMPILEFGASFSLIPMKATNGWLGFNVDVLDQFGPAAQPDDESAYTHKLQFEADAVLGIFQWLPKKNPLTKINAFVTLEYLATGLPEEGDIVPAANPGDPGTLFLEDANPWVLDFGLVIPLMPLKL